MNVWLVTIKVVKGQARNRQMKAVTRPNEFFSVDEAPIKGAGHPLNSKAKNLS